MSKLRLKIHHVPFFPPQIKKKLYICNFSFFFPNLFSSSSFFFLVKNLFSFYVAQNRISFGVYLYVNSTVKFGFSEKLEEKYLIGAAFCCLDGFLFPLP